jgi:hypothetical protein
MSFPFFICGLPRSRTAWLSAVCNTAPHVMCYHEPTAWLPKWQDVVGLLKDSRGYIGAADHGLTVHLPELVSRLDAHVLLVKRERAEVEASMTAAGFGVHAGLFDLCEEVMRQCSYDPRVRWVRYADLDRMPAVMEALHWLMPGADLSAEKIAEMQRLNIQADAARVKREIAAASPERLRAIVGGDILDRLSGS